MALRLLITTTLVFCACTGDFSVNLDDTSDSTGTSNENPSSTDDSSTLTTNVTTASTTETPDSSGDETGSSGSSGEGSSSGDPAESSSTGCEIVGECVPCQKAVATACAEMFPDTPVCGEEGFCVQCTSDNSMACLGETPVCESDFCVGCTYHEQCPESACNIETGACFDASNVREVDGDGGADFENISDALTDGYVILIHEQNGMVPYTESVTITGLTVALLAAPGEHPILQGIGGTSTINIEDSAIVYLQGLDMRGNTDGLGIESIDSTFYVDQSQIVQNNGGGVGIISSVATIRNTIVGGNGGNNFSPTTGISATDSTIDLLYTSVVLNDGDAADSLQCASTTGSIRNSILLGSNSASLNCPGIISSFSAFDEIVGGMSNENVSPLSASWFVNATSNYHLTAMGEVVFETIAQWNLGDPPFDIDGTEPRPSEDASEDVAGADVP